MTNNLKIIFQKKKNVKERPCWTFWPIYHASGVSKWEEIWLWMASLQHRPAFPIGWPTCNRISAGVQTWQSARHCSSLLYCKLPADQLAISIPKAEWVDILYLFDLTIIVNVTLASTYLNLVKSIVSSFKVGQDRDTVVKSLFITRMHREKGVHLMVLTITWKRNHIPRKKLYKKLSSR